MKIEAHTPQDINWELSRPNFRVYFWKRAPTPAQLPPGVTEDRLVYSAFEYELSDCQNVREAFAWAEENTGVDRTYTLYAVVERGGTKGLVRLFGVDPTKHKGDQTLDWPGQVYEDD